MRTYVGLRRLSMRPEELGETGAPPVGYRAGAPNEPVGALSRARCLTTENTESTEEEGGGGDCVMRR